MSNFKIVKLTAFVAIDADSGDEGVIGVQASNGWVPFICADEARIKSILPVAERICAAAGEDYRIIQFAVREDVTEEIKRQFMPSEQAT